MSQAKPPYVEPAAGSGGMTKLHHAAYCGDLAAVRAALDAGIDVDARDDGAWTALHWLADMGMVGSGREQILAVLLAAGAQVEARDLEAQTPLTIACRAGNGDLVRLLLDAGASVDARSRAGTTALMAAASYGEPQTVILLLDRGADPNVVAMDGRTALEWARAQGWDDVVAILSDRQAKLGRLK